MISHWEQLAPCRGSLKPLTSCRCIFFYSQPSGFIAPQTPRRAERLSSDKALWTSVDWWWISQGHFRLIRPPSLPDTFARAVFLSADSCSEIVSLHIPLTLLRKPNIVIYRWMMSEQFCVFITLFLCEDQKNEAVTLCHQCSRALTPSQTQAFVPE